jgi:hypothetical protein
MPKAAATTLLFAATALASLWPVLVRPGWPSNHEGLAFRFRTLVYAFHFAQGDLLPIWSSEDFHGLGTPLPFFYHKLFYALSGALYWLLPSLKASLVCTLAALLVVGSLGLHRTLLRLGVPYGIAAAVAATLPFQGYTLCDWLVRGAMAELAACMMVPWVLFSLIHTIRVSRVPWHLYANLFLLALAHSVVAYFAAWLALLGLAFAFAGVERARLWAEARRAALFGAAWLAAVSPLLLVQLRLGRHYGVGAITSGLYDPARHFQGFVSGQLWATSWRWGHTDRWSPVQFNPETSLFLVVAVAGIALCWRRSGLGRGRGDRTLAFLLVALALFCLLQLPPAEPLYEWVPGFRFVQFPWRLMAIAQALVLSLVGLGVSCPRCCWPRRSSRTAAFIPSSTAGSRARTWSGWPRPATRRAFPASASTCPRSSCPAGATHPRVAGPATG